MVAIFILAGGLFGFTSAVASLVLIGASLPMALAIWSGVGLLSVGLGVAMSLTQRRAMAADASFGANHHSA